MDVMKKIIFLFTLFSSTFVGLAQQSESNSEFKWTEEMRKQHLKNMEDSTSWDVEKLDLDKQVMGLDMAGPFELAAWPVPKYERIAGDSEVANGNVGDQLSVNGQTIYMNAFYIHKNPVNEEYLKDQTNEVFMHLLVLSDTEEPDAQSVIWSRNYPDFFGQGYVKTASSNIEYASFITAERDAFAIINTRLFNLNYGKTILVAPQADGTLRSMQIDSPELTKESVKEYSAQLLQRAEVTQFFD